MMIDLVFPDKAKADRERKTRICFKGQDSLLPRAAAVKTPMPLQDV
jgi:hypothetical protein